MGLSGCYAVLKYIVVLVNFIFWLAGLAVFGLAIWLLTDPAVYLSMAQTQMQYQVGIYIFLAAGALMFIMGFIGCCGAYKESPCMLVSFFCLLFIIVVAEVAAGAWAYSHREELEVYVKESVKATIQEEYGMADSRTVTFDSIQKNLKCCGASGPKDWASSKYNEQNKHGLDLAVSSLGVIYKIPASCCRPSEDSALCKAAQEAGLGAAVSGVIYTEGCTDKLINALRDHMNIVVGVMIGVGIVEILGLIFSLILCCAIRSVDRYKN